ncbi:MAG TPA: hypothetical protein VMR65_08010 [Candidatus Sulfotelmatobacter sp.]|jgi:hypothetical protein|nr:hypothetical protein [Candidatus Sulfotelmatobacter sp.]
MITRKAGEAAKAGFYFNPKTWDIHLHRSDGAILPTGEGERYLRVPTVALLVLGPAMGFLFVIFLPAIGFALVFREAWRRMLALFGKSATARRKEAKVDAR